MIFFYISKEAFFKFLVTCFWPPINYRFICSYVSSYYKFLISLKCQVLGCVRDMKMNGALSVPH